MAGCGGKKMAYGGKVKKMKEGGMSEADKKLFGEKETDAPEPDNFKKSRTKQEAEDKNKKLDRLIEQKTNIDRVKYGKKKGGKVKKGMHMMPDGTMMKDSAHKKPMKKMKAGGKVRGDGICSKGKTKGRMI